MLLQDKLKIKVKVIYYRRHLTMIQNALNILFWMSEDDLNKTFAETIKLFKVIVITPMFSAESELCFSTLKGNKTLDTINKARLNVSMISINKKLNHFIDNLDEKVFYLFPW